jgi:multiple sugar transport system substrate-binding protein
MQALRPFTTKEIPLLGGAEAFFESVWRSGFLINDPTLWAVPWLGDAMMIYFWENALQEAGICDFEAAFSTDSALVETLEKLRRSGIAHPLNLNIQASTMILHEAAHWLWSAGGDFISADGRQVIFNQPAALEGFKKYFSLKPFISPELLYSPATASLFNAGKAAIQFAGPWLSTSIHRHKASDERRLGIAPVPGTAFTGGCSLIIWQYTTHPQEAFEWVRFLATQPAHAPTDIYRHQVPTRREALHVPLMENDIFQRTYFQYLQSMQRGRSFPTMRLWGSMEEKLVLEISRIWAELFANLGQDLDECLHRHLDPIAKRLNITLEN